MPSCLPLADIERKSTYDLGDGPTQKAPLCRFPRRLGAGCYGTHILMSDVSVRVASGSVGRQSLPGDVRAVDVHDASSRNGGRGALERFSDNLAGTVSDADLCRATGSDSKRNGKSCSTIEKP